MPVAIIIVVLFLFPPCLLFSSFPFRLPPLLLPGPMRFIHILPWLLLLFLFLLLLMIDLTLLLRLARPLKGTVGFAPRCPRSPASALKSNALGSLLCQCHLPALSPSQGILRQTNATDKPKANVLGESPVDTPDWGLRNGVAVPVA